MQLRRSPGGSILKSLRRRPEEPPSSVTVTMAARSEMMRASAVWPGTATYLRRPRRRVDRPVPPPMAATRRGACGANGLELLTVSSSGGLGLRDFRVEQFGESRVVVHVLEVSVGAGLKAVAAIGGNGLREAVEAVFHLAGDGVEDGEPVVGVCGLGADAEDGEELLAGFFEVVGIEQGDGVVVLLFEGVKDEGSAGELTLAGAYIHAAPLGCVGGSGGQQLFERDQGLFKFGLLHELQSCLIVLVKGPGMGSSLCLFPRGGSGRLFTAGRWNTSLLRHCRSVAVQARF